MLMYITRSILKFKLSGEVVTFQIGLATYVCEMTSEYDDNSIHSIHTSLWPLECIRNDVSVQLLDHASYPKSITCLFGPMDTSSCDVLRTMAYHTYYVNQRP